MTTVLCAKASLASTWITFSEISAILGERFANSLRDSYASIYERVVCGSYKPDQYEIEPSFRLDIVFAFVNDCINKHK